MNEQPDAHLVDDKLSRMTGGMPNELLGRYLRAFLLIGLIDCLLVICLIITVAVLVALVVLIINELTSRSIHYAFQPTWAAALAVLLVGPLFILQRYLVTQFRHLKKLILELMRAGMEKSSI